MSPSSSLPWGIFKLIIPIANVRSMVLSVTRFTCHLPSSDANGDILAVSARQNLLANGGSLVRD